ncbi:hypothetical protein C8A05DRAFT_39833 [Staphylotrichum tortipilum]|uniref:Uncharacterized protein n=1 Tax=Staphylotrichum tortipilum TaxID=2831512 RepID=A0AAN6RNR1_9PEZI|nr:hypothetical protein C8A05DRAFT_39833 [Staphylotrichum longicolle]
MHLLSIVFALATAATVIHAASTSAPDDKVLELHGAPCGAANTSHASSPNDLLDKRGELPWSVIGYTEPYCQGDVVWLGTGDTTSNCRDMVVKAESIRVGVRGGTRVSFWNEPGYCHLTAIPPPDAALFWYDFEGGEGRIMTTCLVHKMYGYEVSRLG